MKPASKSSSASSSISDLGHRAVRRAVPVAVLLRRALRRRDELGEHAGERVDLVAPKLGARGGARGILGEHALEPEHEPVAHLPARRRLLETGVHLGDRVVERGTSCRARARAPAADPRPAARNGSPNQDSARRAAAVRFSDVSDVSVGMVVASCIQAARLSVPLLPKS